MKRKLLFALMSLLAMTALAQTRVRDHVEVMYFHGKQRCATCMAIEKYAREVVEKDFANEKKKGKVVFKIVDISTDEGEKTAKKYRVTWSSLFVNGWKAGKEKRNDMTQFAFKNARKNSDEFKRGVSGKIKELMK
ncbi:MAG: nitrophenyl compound nitroreductase subunit ArsF family protein [Bacteroidales bacterium]|nr:nitrophenyl compound nitroreductase subunit ArsF family protein [Bacteroidales bacterium]MDY3742989.1 nitrophenyl compound nitroreductase subunit ArsF family protein [Prevotella sp.]MDY5035908.1 nitrophenyl compound nitroreductase subunit ArsF family protein [Prevotella sp.]